MSASVGVYVATAIYLAIGWDTEEGLGFEWYSDLGMGPCRREQDYHRHARLLDARPCMTTLFNPPSSLDKDEDEPPVPEQGVELFDQVWVPADQPTSNEPLPGHWLKLRLEVAEAELPPRPRGRTKSAATPADGPWGPGRILAAIEAHVRTLAAVPATLIQRIREGR